MSEKREIEDNITKHRNNTSNWHEPLLKWVEQAQTLDVIARTGGGTDKRTACRNLFGTNLNLGSACVRVGKAFNSPKASKKGEKMMATPWVALTAAAFGGDNFAKRDTSVLY
jgi:hypothetical protein